MPTRFLNVPTQHCDPCQAEIPRVEESGDVRLVTTVNSQVLSLEGAARSNFQKGTPWVVGVRGKAVT